MSKSSLSVENINLKDILESFNSVLKANILSFSLNMTLKCQTLLNVFLGRCNYYHMLTLNEFEFVKKRKLKKETRCYIGNWRCKF